MIKRRAFTLVELLMVIAIIGILSALAVTSLIGSQAKARDTKRKTSARNMHVALTQYHLDNSASYPIQATGGGESINNSSTLYNALVNGEYLNSNSPSFSPDKNAKYISTGTGNAYAQAWELETSSEALNVSGNGVYGTNSSEVAGVVTPPANAGGGVNFNGLSDSYIGVASATTFWSGNFTLSAWINPTDITARRTIISRDQGTPVAGSAYELAVLSGGQIELRVSKGGATTTTYTATTTGTPIAVGSWYHLAVSINGAVPTFYVNGTAVTSTTSPAWVAGAINQANATQLRIGARSANTLSPFHGTIDDVRIYDTNLTVGRITSLYNSGIGAYSSDAETGLLMGFRFDEAIGSTTNSFKPTAPLVGTFQSTNVTWVTGKTPIGLTGIGSNSAGRAFVTYGPQ